MTQVRVDQLQIKETQQENADTNEHIVQVCELAVPPSAHVGSAVCHRRCHRKNPQGSWHCKPSLMDVQARKQLGHTMLISEIFSELKFPAKPVLPCFALT